VFINAKIEKDVFALRSPVSGQNIGLNNLQSKTDVRLGVNIRQSGCDVKFFRHLGLF
jgi:hypothetical protein